MAYGVWMAGWVPIVSAVEREYGNLVTVEKLSGGGDDDDDEY